MRKKKIQFNTTANTKGNFLVCCTALKPQTLNECFCVPETFIFSFMNSIKNCLGCEVSNNICNVLKADDQFTRPSNA